MLRAALASSTKARLCSKNVIHSSQLVASSSISYTLKISNNSLLLTLPSKQIRFYAEAQREKSPKSKHGKESSFKRLSHEECVQVYDFWKSQGKQINFTFYRQFLQHCNTLCWEHPQYVEKALSIAEDMKKDGITWNLEVYFILIQCCIRSKTPQNLDKAFALQSEMEKIGIKSTQLIYNSLIRGCALLDQVERAKPVFADLMKLKDIPQGIKFDDVYKHLKEL